MPRYRRRYRPGRRPAKMRKLKSAPKAKRSIESEVLASWYRVYHKYPLTTTSPFIILFLWNSPGGHRFLQLAKYPALPTGVIMMVMTPLSWARAGKEKTKASIMVTTILVITTFICPSEFDGPPLAVSGQSFSGKRLRWNATNSRRLLSRPCPQYHNCLPFGKPGQSCLRILTCLMPAS